MHSLQPGQNLEPLRPLTRPGKLAHSDPQSLLLSWIPSDSKKGEQSRPGRTSQFKFTPGYKGCIEILWQNTDVCQSTCDWLDILQAFRREEWMITRRLFNKMIHLTENGISCRPLRAMCVCCVLACLPSFPTRRGRSAHLARWYPERGGFTIIHQPEESVTVTSMTVI